MCQQQEESGDSKHSGEDWKLVSFFIRRNILVSEVNPECSKTSEYHVDQWSLDQVGDASKQFVRRIVSDVVERR